MATETYFKNFNTIQYGNNTVVDITERVVVLDSAQKNPYAYYPLDITNGARPDQIANQNYNDPYASWVLYLSNDIVDPYYEWYLTQDQFIEFIKTKYVTVENAMKQIAFWRNDWVDKLSISTLEYSAEISGNPNRIKYWSANYSYSGNIVSYSRTKADWITNTNKILKYSTDPQITPFNVNEIVTIGDGRAQVVYSNSSVTIVNNTIDITEDISGSIIGTESGTSVNYSAIQTLANNISDNEIYYWTPVSYYEVENEKNQGNKTIRLLQPQYVPRFIQDTKILLSNK